MTNFRGFLIDLGYFLLLAKAGSNQKLLKCPPANMYLLKVNNRNPRKHISFRKPYFTPFSSVSIVDFEQSNVSWANT